MAELKSTTNNLEMPEIIKMEPDPRRDGVGSNKLNSKDIDRLPITSVVPTYTTVDGTYIFYDNGTDTRELYARLGGAWYSVALT